MKAETINTIQICSTILSYIVSIIALVFMGVFATKIQNKDCEPDSCVIVRMSDSQYGDIAFQLQEMQQKVDILWNESKENQ